MRGFGMGKSTTNEFCLACNKAHNGLNGRWCARLKAYVENAKTPPCMDTEAELTERKQQY